MPFDPFFSSANKHHYIRSDRYEQEVMPEVSRVLALPEDERGRYVSALRVRASRHELTLTEKHILRKLQFIYLRKHKAIQARMFYARKQVLRKTGLAFFGGYNTGSR